MGTESRFVLPNREESVVRSTRLVPLLLVFAMLAACGGDGSVFEGSTTTAAPGVEDVVDARALAAGEAIVFSLSPEPGMLAVGYALDRGFTAAQIAEAGLAETLMTDGTIIGIEPTLGLQGIFSDLPAAGAGATGGGAKSASTFRGLIDEPNPYAYITADQWLAGLAIESDRVVSGLETPSAPSSGASTTTRPEVTDEQAPAALMIGLIVQLSDMGYSAEQIILGITLGEVRITLLGTGLGPTPCWLLEDSATGGAVSPARPAAGGVFSLSGSCREAIDQLAPPGSDSTSTTTTGTTSTTTTTLVADADGIPNGIYTGGVRVIGDPERVYELSDTIAEVEVTDDAVRVTLEFTARVAMRVRGMDPVCIATTRRAYFGQGSPAADIEVPMEPQLQEIIALEGLECGVVEGWWSTSAEDNLLAEFAQELGFALVGSFSGGTFEGNVGGVLGVTATTGE